MKTPKIFKQRINEGVVSHEMLGACIYSLCTRAQIYRNRYDLYNDYRHHYHKDRDKYQRYMVKAQKKNDEYGGYSKSLLRKLKPCEIHICNTWSDLYQAPIRRYYLYYSVAGYSFHQSIYDFEVSNYNLKSVEIPCASTTKEPPAIRDLISVQFAEKVFRGLSDGSLRLVA